MLGILCGLESEAVIARRVTSALVGCGAARPGKSRDVARELIQKGAKSLMSFGIAGALEPGLPIGSMVIGTQVMSVKGQWDCDRDWSNELSRRLPNAHCGGIWGSEFLIPTASDKRTLYQKSRCMIVDMESQCVAEIATEAKIPFAVIRVICDSSEMDVPPLVMDAITEDGSIHIGRALGSILRHPSQIPALIHVGQGTKRALKILARDVTALAA